MTINMTIIEAKKALQKEAKRIRKEHELEADLLKVTCNTKQQENGEFTIYSRDLTGTKELILDLGRKFGNLVGIEKCNTYNWAVNEGRVRFKFMNRDQDICGKDVDMATTEEDDNECGKDTPIEIISSEVLGELREVAREACVEQGLAEHQITVARYIDFTASRSNAYVVTLIDTNFCDDQDRLTAFARYGYLVEVRRVAENQTEYIFCTFTEVDKRAIMLDLRKIVTPEVSEEATERAMETPRAVESTHNSKPLAEAKKDILKHAGKVRKQHNIAGSDFRIICTDYHISIGEFILFTKGANYEHLLYEFEQFGTHYTTERAGEDAMRYRFDYKKAN